MGRFARAPPFPDYPFPEDPFEFNPDFGGDPLGYQVASEAQRTANDYLGIVYNPSGLPLSAADYLVMGTGLGPDGRVAAGIDLPLPAAIPPHSWLVVVVPSDAATVFTTGSAPGNFRFIPSLRPAAP